MFIFYLPNMLKEFEKKENCRFIDKCVIKTKGYEHAGYMPSC